MFAERLPRVARNCVSRPIFLSHLETKFIPAGSEQKCKTVTAEVAGSSPVVPAIIPKDLRNDSAPENNKSKFRDSLRNQFGGSPLL
jgi:hypothetical protein